MTFREKDADYDFWDDWDEEPEEPPRRSRRRSSRTPIIPNGMRYDSVAMGLLFRLMQWQSSAPEGSRRWSITVERGVTSIVLVHDGDIAMRTSYDQSDLMGDIEAAIMELGGDVDGFAEPTED